MKPVLWGALLLGLGGFALMCRGVPAPLAGDWIGQLDIGGERSLVRARFSVEDGVTKGSLDIPYEFVTGREITGIDVAAPRVRFELMLSGLIHRFEGRIEGGEMLGRIDSTAGPGSAEPRAAGGSGGTLNLARVVHVERTVLDGYAGAYRVAPDRFLYVQTWDEFGPGQLACFDESGEARALHARSETEFFAGPGAMTPLPIETEIVFERGRDGRVRGIRLRRADSPETFAERADLYTEEPIGFANGDVRLSGVLITPHGRGPHPAIIVLHGSGDQDRRGSLPFVNFLARQGIALLLYDKRGVGGSTGDWRRAGFDELAADALAAVAYLKGRTEIDPARIGLFGASQGGWIGPLAASRSADVAFVVSLSGPGVTPAQQELDRMGALFRSYGLSDDDVAEYEAFQKQVFEVARTGQGRERLEAAAAAAGDRDWFSPELVPPDDHWTWRFWRLIQDHDPVPVLRAVRCPVLALFGELDTTVPGRKNRDIWDRTLKGAGHLDHTLVIFPRANHVLFEAETGSQREFPRLRGFVPGYSSTLQAWMREHLAGTGASRPPAPRPPAAR